MIRETGEEHAPLTRYDEYWFGFTELDDADPPDLWGEDGVERLVAETRGSREEVLKVLETIRDAAIEAWYDYGIP